MQTVNTHGEVAFMPGGVALISLESAREYTDKENHLVKSTKVLSAHGASPVCCTSISAAALHRPLAPYLLSRLSCSYTHVLHHWRRMCLNSIVVAFLKSPFVYVVT